jgi:hypothetical protein
MSGDPMSDRTVHASLVDPDDGVTVEIVRYDRQGRWYKEIFRLGERRVFADRQRYGTVHDAADAAMDLEAEGGTVHTGRPGGKQFDAKVAGARGRMSRR